MASRPTPSKEEESNKIMREEEEVTSTERVGKELVWVALLSCPQGRSNIFYFEELFRSGLEALKRHSFAEAVEFFETSLRFRIINMSGPESIKTMLKYAHIWFYKGQFICQYSRRTRSVVADLISDLRAKWMKMTYTIANKILHSLPDDDSTEKEEILSFFADDDILTKYGEVLDCSAVVDRLRNKANPVVSDTDLEKEMQFRRLASYFMADQTLLLTRPPPS